MSLWSTMARKILLSSHKITATEDPGNANLLIGESVRRQSGDWRSRAFGHRAR